MLWQLPNCPVWPMRMPRTLDRHCTVIVNVVILKAQEMEPKNITAPSPLPQPTTRPVGK